MNRLLMTTIALLVAAMTAAAPAAAQPMDLGGFYLGGTLGQAEQKGVCDGVANCDEKDTAWRLLGGYQFNRNFAAELGFHDLGEVSAPGVTGESSAWELVGIGAFPLGAQFSVYGKLGFYRGEQKAAGLKETNTDLTYGAGVQFDLSRQAALRGEWQRYPDMGGPNVGGENDADVVSLGLLWRF